jgi:hypothetical protein
MSSLDRWVGGGVEPRGGRGAGRADRVQRDHDHPPGTLPEYIEVFNNTATPFDIAGWKLRDGVDYDFPAFAAGDPSASFLKPFERILLAPVDEATLRAAYNIAPTIRVFGAWTGNLDNAGERVTLKDKNGIVLCTVQYNDRGQWPRATDGAGPAWF